MAHIVQLWCACVLALALPALAHAQAPIPAPAASDKARLIVTTDIGGDPDDEQSMVRLLVYANQYDIEGLIATRPFRGAVNARLIEDRVRAYGEVLANLRRHARGYPDAETLLGVVREGSSGIEMSGVGDGRETAASRLIVEAVDRPDPRPVWVTVWGGAADLAQALWTVRATRTPEETAQFISKLRVYAISDQDDAGAWIRAAFPHLFYVSSIHAFRYFGASTWSGINANAPGADPSLIQEAWLDQNVRAIGPLGALYSRTRYAMEGDTPSFLYLMPNGLGNPERPDWGSWGGRYGQVSPHYGLWADVEDSVVGVDGARVSSNKATVFRWRRAFQHDFAARMQWTVTSHFRDANHEPQPALNGNRGAAPLIIETCAGRPVTLSARGTRDPDGDALTYRWWHYADIVGSQPPPRAELTVVSDTEARVSAALSPAASIWPRPPMRDVHVILEVTDNGSPALTRYRHAVVRVVDDPSGQGSCRAMANP